MLDQDDVRDDTPSISTNASSINLMSPFILIRYCNFVTSDEVEHKINKIDRTTKTWWSIGCIMDGEIHLFNDILVRTVDTYRYNDIATMLMTHFIYVDTNITLSNRHLQLGIPSNFSYPNITSYLTTVLGVPTNNSWSNILFNISFLY